MLIKAKSLFYNKIKEVARANYQAQQQRFLASASTSANVQQQKSSFLASGAFKRSRQPSKPQDLNRTSRTGLKLKLSPLRPALERTFLRGTVTLNSFPPLNMPRLPQSSESQPFPLLILPCPDIPVGGRLAHFVEQWGELTHNKWILSTIWDGFWIAFRSTPLFRQFW